MIFHRFIETDGVRVVLCEQADGGKLPVTGNGWERCGTIEMDENTPPRIGARFEDVRAAIAKDGFFIGPT